MNRGRRGGLAHTFVALALSVAAGCTTVRPAAVMPPAGRELVVLVPEPGSGAVGKATVAAGGTTIALAGAGDAAESSGGRAAARVVDDAEIARRFGAVLAAIPEAAEHFDLYFQNGDTRLTEASQALVPQIVAAVRRRALADVSVIGHTDTVGRRSANVRLGLRRARIVERLLLEAGVPAEIEVSSHGEADLLVETGDGTPEPRNRRAQVSVR